MSNLIEEQPRYQEALCAASLKDFCDGYRWMFEKDIRRTTVASETLPFAQIQSSTSGIIAVFSIRYSDGEDEGSLMILLEHSAAFTLGGLTVMLPLPRVKEYCSLGREDDVRMLSDAIAEVGNLLKGSFEKSFRAGVPGADGRGEEFSMHLQLPIPLGEIALPDMNGCENVNLFTYSLSIAGLDPFQVKVILPTK